MNENAGAMIAAGANLAGTVTTNISQAALSKKEWERNMKTAQWQFDKNLEMWNLQNSYNSPTQQMKRLTDAGLNPNLVYGNGSVAGNTTSSHPEMKAAEYKAPNLKFDLASTIGAYQDIKLKQAQVDNLSAQTANTAAQTANEAIKGQLISSQITGQGHQNTIASVLAANQAEIVSSNLRQTQSTTQKILKELGIMDVDKDLKTAQIKNLGLDNSIKKQEYEKRLLQIDLNKYGISDSDNPLLKVLIRAIEGAKQGKLDQYLSF